MGFCVSFSIGTMVLMLGINPGTHFMFHPEQQLYSSMAMEKGKHTRDYVSICISLHTIGVNVRHNFY